MIKTEHKALLTQGLIELGLSPAENILEKMMRLIELFMYWNKKSNLSAIRDEKGIIIKHILDSLSVIPVLKRYELWNTRLKAVDLGSGGGFPGAPLLIAEPDMPLDFAEVNKKKICFLNELILNLPLQGKQVIDSSAGKVNPEYQLLFTRAFGSIKQIVKEARKYITNGRIIAYKGTLLKTRDEIAELSADIKQKTIIEEIKTPFLSDERHLVMINI
ncbi:MAG: 16S rRNA (guanine(527)-N(7))-methyltransferase RsmG [Spirochaetota bacterium]|nr:16S rRNA (guanine(527)-N(7))-methyltransferase RsmG [Spirochaetota bacterium]